VTEIVDEMTTLIKERRLTTGASKLNLPVRVPTTLFTVMPVLRPGLPLSALQITAVDEVHADVEHCTTSGAIWPWKTVGVTFVLPNVKPASVRDWPPENWPLTACMSDTTGASKVKIPFTVPAMLLMEIFCHVRPESNPVVPETHTTEDWEDHELVEQSALIMFAVGVVSYIR